MNTQREQDTQRRQKKVVRLVFHCLNLFCGLTTITLFLYIGIDIKPEIQAEDARWQQVGGASHKFYVYSAYYDSSENGSLIRIVSATKLSKSDKVLCKLWYPDTTLTAPGEIEIIGEHHNLNYTACFIKCPFAGHTIPESVSVVTRYHLNPTNHLQVIHTKRYEKTNQTSKSIGLCVKPLHNIYNKTVQLVEFMELNRILGMGHVTFYNSSISPTTNCILRNYIGEGRATVLPWKHHFISQKEIRTENIMAALNDCLYRNRHNFSYLAFLDMDEFIMPAQNDTIQEMLETLDAGDNKHQTASYIFRNGFFYLQWPNDPTTTSSDDVYEINLITLLKTRRMRKLHKHFARSKYIVKPIKIVTAGNHLVHELVSGYKRFRVSPSRGILNHYRICEYGGNGCIKTPSQVDRTAFRYKYRLVAAVKRRWQDLQRKCRIGDIQQATDLQQSTPRRHTSGNEIQN